MESYQRVDWYNVEETVWKRAPDLNVPRAAHSGCSIGEKTYVFCGATNGRKAINSIESLNAEDLIAGTARLEWDLIEVPVETLAPRWGLIVAPINENEIVVMGGYKAGYFGDGYLFDVNTLQLQQVFDTGLKFAAWFNPSQTYTTKTKQDVYIGYVAALVTNNLRGGDLMFLTYKKGQIAPTVIEDLGPWK